MGRKKISELNLSDNFMFVNVMSDEEICKMFLEKLLRIKIDELKVVQYEKQILLNTVSRDIRLDIYVKDSDGKIYDIEMQKRNYDDEKYDIPRRTRYYQALLDTKELKHGKTYNELPDSYIIFICTFDEFGYEKSRYVFEKQCIDNHEIVLQDGAKLIILNTKGAESENDKEIQSFLRYIENSTEDVAMEIDSEFLKKLHQKVELVKSDKEVEYMTLQELIDIENRQAKKENTREIAKAMKENGVDIEVIAKCTKLSKEDIEAL